MIDVQKITGHQSKLDTKTFRIQALTPVFIGAGTNLIKGVDIIEHNGDTVRLDLNKVYHQYIERDPDGLTSAIEEGELRNFLKDEDISGLIAQKFNGKCLGQELMDHVRDGFGNPIIPGSSLKGSLKTALMHYLFSRDNKAQMNYKGNFFDRNNRKLPTKRASNQLQNKLFTTSPSGFKVSPPNFDIGRVFRPSDATFNLDKLEIINTAVLNITRNGTAWKILGRRNGPKNSEHIEDATIVSVFGINEKAEFNSLKISLDFNSLKSIKWNGHFDWHTLQEAANRLSKNILFHEIDFLDENISYDDEEILIDQKKELIKKIDKITSEAKENERLCWVKRMGWGSGWLSMTGMHMNDEQFDIARNLYPKDLRKNSEIFPKTRKIVLDNQNKPHSTMGWVLVEEVSE